MPRGGKRKGAGAPKGNLNALKHGGYSRQFAEIGALMVTDPTVRELLLKGARRTETRRHEANELAALYLSGLYKRAVDIASGQHAGGLEGLNLNLPHHVADSIKAAASDALRRQTRQAVREARKNSRRQNNNQPSTGA